MLAKVIITAFLSRNLWFALWKPTRQRTVIPVAKPTWLCRLHEVLMKTELCHLLGIEHPIIAAPMGPDLTGPEFVAAVSNAGGLAFCRRSLHLRISFAPRSGVCANSRTNHLV